MIKIHQSTKTFEPSIRPDYEEERGSFNCSTRNCDICNILESGNDFKSANTEDVYKILFNFICNIKCVVYLLICENCRKQYLG